MNLDATSTKRRLTKAMDELSSSAICFGAVSHRDYKGANVDELRLRARRRLDRAAKRYHELVIALSFLSDNSRR